ncbi:MAG TPA: glycosyltransferase family 9 protein [Candidatus Limnocylindrales bacterium]|nr:glycosyltransferase family 9 protein [Candidatus Limnocylindrales bacterium]
MRKPKRILVIFDDCGPGDALCLSFCLQALRKAHPTATIDLLVGGHASPVFEHAEGFGRIVVSHLYGRADGQRPLSPVRKAMELARLALRLGRGYDLAITFLWGTTALNVLARWAARRSFGYANKWPSLHASDLGPYEASGEPIELAIELLAAAGVSATPDIPYLRLPEPPHGSTAVGASRGSNRVVVHVGSDWACQQWQPDRWAEVADRLIARYGVDVVFTGLANEGAYIDEIRAAMQQDSVSFAGATTVAELAEVLAGARLCVCVDSLIFELAQAAGTPIVVLAGQSRTRAAVASPSNPIVVNRTTPELRAAILACKTRVSKASYGACRNFACPMAGLRDISVTDVLEAIEAQGVLAPVESGVNEAANA